MLCSSMSHNCSLSALDIRELTLVNFSSPSNSTSSSGSQLAGLFLPPYFRRHAMIAMRVSDRLGEAVRYRTSFFIHVASVDSTVVRPTRCLKGLPTRSLSNRLPFGGTLTILPAWCAAKFGPLRHYKAQCLRRLRTKPVE